MSIERRQTSLKQAKRVTVKRDENGEPTEISGYSAVFYDASKPDSEYWLYDDHVERLQVGCFDNVLEDDARALYNHQPENLLGRVSNGTCELWVDDIGLGFRVPIDNDDPDHLRVIAKIKRGDLSGCSFAFSNPSSTWEETEQDGKAIWIRNITDVGNLHDVGPVTYPAYEATEVGLRTAAPNQAELANARSALAAHRQDIDNQRWSQKIEIDERLAELG